MCLRLSAALYKIIGSDISNIDQIQTKEPNESWIIGSLIDVFFDFMCRFFTESQAIRVIRQVFDKTRRWMPTRFFIS